MLVNYVLYMYVQYVHRVHFLDLVYMYIHVHVLSRPSGVAYRTLKTLTKNIDSLRMLLHQLNHNFSIIGLSETWLKEEAGSYLNLPGYILETVNRDHKAGGGVALYISSDLTYLPRPDLSISVDSLECYFVEIISCKHKNIIAGVVYKPPNANFNDFITCFHNLIQRITNENKSCLISGDFNLNLIDCDHRSQPQEFLDLIFSSACIPLINKPTRITQSSATLIDNIFTNILPPPKSGIIVTDISDHFPIFTSFSFNANHSSSKHVPTHNYSMENIDHLKNDLNSCDWSDVLCTLDVNMAFNKFMDIFNRLHDKNIPLKNIKSSSRKFTPKSPWISVSMCKSIHHKNKLYRRFISHPTDPNRAIYVRYKNILTTVIRNSKRMYYAKQFEKEKGNVKNTWKIINSVLKNKTLSKLSSIDVNGAVVNNSHFIADHFNTYFTNIGNNLSNKIPLSDRNFNDYLLNSNSSSIFLAPVTEQEILDIVNNLPNKKSSGHDLVNNFLIKSVILAISMPITFIMNLSMSTGVVPDDMKIARITPIFKSGDTQQVNNYRPISVLTSFSKILERIVYTCTSKFFDNHNILSDSQFGFREKHSTSHAILQLLDKISNSIDDSSHTLGIFLDLSKAFDTVNHKILLSKLAHYGIRGIALEWFRSYLTKRHQFVSINGCVSSLAEISHGVPQGSILGPLLFSIYINDFDKSSNLLSFILFADDSNLFYTHSNLNVLFDTVNSELNNISSWIRANKLSLNIKKTSFMLFSKKVTHHPQIVYIDNNQIPRTDCLKFLGLYIDQDLSWKQHVNYLCKIISRNVGIINKLKHFFPREVLVTLYNALILPYINYGILAWGNSGIAQINRLLILQKKAFRIINYTDYLAHCDPLFYKHNSLKISDIYLLQLGIFMYKLNSNNLPQSICSLFTKNINIHDHFTRQCNEFHQSFARTTLSYRTIKHEGPRLWYSLDSNLKSTSTLIFFKRKFKDLLLSKYL